MSEDQKTKVEANSREFTRGVEAGLKSEDTKYWQAGYELGQGLSDQAAKEPDKEIIPDETASPLFLEDTLSAHDGDAQDEKNKSTE